MICPRTFTRVRKNVIYLELLSFIFMNTSSFACDCKQLSANKMIMFLLQISGLGSSIREFRYLECNTVLKKSPFGRITTGFLNECFEPVECFRINQ